ncbi:MerR family transcriptional regulator [Methylocapsa sp. D3K7]|uniref:MerR family transcriptional regulator n=1 Tax=Methylocapsa sp. D3K7 TaxID=3041435 RepID=UPI00244EE6F5|nr:MerR family transcriptional regulator [Methylocapsa sp. D3K7]WGJ15988.1 MerR family transcriptional regulator [Methylocapsa sp. D3K7]
MNKNADAFRTISEVAGELDLPQHVLRFWETRFPQIKPLKRAGGRRYYRPKDIEVLRAIKHLLYKEGYTIRGVQRVLKEQGSGALAAMEDAGNIACLDMSEGMEYDLTAHHEAPSPEDGGMGRSGSGAFADPPGALADLGEAADAGRKVMGGAFVLSGENIERLRAALAELAECASILDAAQRQ